MTISPVTAASIARARAQQQRDRAEVEAETGVRITDDGRIVPGFPIWEVQDYGPMTILHTVAVSAHRGVIQGLFALEHEVAYAASVDEALALQALLASLYQHVDQIERLARLRADALIGGSNADCA